MPATLKVPIRPMDDHTSSSMSVNNYHGLISDAKTYCAYSDLNKTIQWQSLGREGADVLVDSDGKPAALTIVGAVVNDKLIAGPLGNFQSQEDKPSKFDNKMHCDQAKLVVVIGMPSRSEHPNWAQDFESATKNLKEIQEAVVKLKPNAPRLHFLDFKAAGDLATARFTHALWEKKVNFLDPHNILSLIPSHHSLQWRRMTITTVIQTVNPKTTSILLMTN